MPSTDAMSFDISRSQFIPDSSRIFRPEGKQIFIRYQSSVSLFRPLRFVYRHRREGNENERERKKKVELFDKLLAITWKQRRRTDIYGLRSIYTLRYVIHIRVCVAHLDVRRCAGFRVFFSYIPSFCILLRKKPYLEKL